MARVLVLSPWQQDQILALSTLPALVEALRAQGHDARLHGDWDFVWDPTDLTSPNRLAWRQRLWRGLVLLVPGNTDPYGTYAPAPDRYGHPLRWREPAERRAQLDERFWSTLDLTDVDVVVTPGWDIGRRVYDLPGRSAATTVVVADFHMLEGAHPWARETTPPGVLIKLGAWWPGDDLRVHACFPSYQLLYANAGVPDRAITWMGYPLHVPHHTSDVSPGAATYAFAGGRHDRDWATLGAAASTLSLRRPIRVHGPAEAGSTGLDHRGEVDVARFIATIRDSRYVVVPLHGGDNNRASGISVAALAHAAGRPVIATDTPAMRDTIADGVDGLLVPPKDPVALAAAITRLDQDDAELAKLADGARLAAARIDVSAWARKLVPEGP